MDAQVARIVSALKLFVEPGGVTELRAFGVPSYNGQRTTIIHGYFDDLERMAEEASKLSGRAVGVYFIPNPVKPALLGRCANRVQPALPDSGTKDHEVVSRRCLPVDLDPVRPTGVSSTDEEHELAIDRGFDVEEFLVAQDWPAPIVGDSGNGCHLFFRINLPNDDASRELVKGVLRAIAARFDDDRVKIDPATFNAARLMRIPGTMACKGDDIRNQPHRLANLFKGTKPCA
jgi:hypothetical protein